MALFASPRMSLTVDLPQDPAPTEPVDPEMPEDPFAEPKPAPSPESLLIALRSEEATALLTEQNWAPAEQAADLTVRVGVRRYVYPVPEQPGASIEYVALGEGAARGRVQMTLRVPRGTDADGARRALRGLARLLERTRGVRANLTGLGRD